MNKKRLPTMESSIRALINEGVRITTVVDVGVLKGTDYLRTMFPSAFHHLFEPMREYLDEIETNYLGIPHKLHPVALSSTNGESYQISISRDGTGLATHSFLSDSPATSGSTHSGASVVNCISIEKRVLDECLGGLSDAESYLVKIDVDGHELPIIEGGRNIISGADIVIVEATVSTLIDRALKLRELGHHLVDIVDLCYYHDMLSQVDLIFASDALLKRSPGIRPWGYKTFSNEAWITLNHQLIPLTRPS